MQIQLDEKTKAEVIAQAKKQMLAELMSQFNVKQIAAEIRNAAVNKASQELAKEMWKNTNADRHLNRALASVNDRLEARIQEVLAKGIKVQFNGLVPDKESQ